MYFCRTLLFLMAFVPSHRILIIDASLKNCLDESDPAEFSRRYFDAMLDAVRMKPLAPMSISRSVDSAAPGFSGVQEITTSHTSFHYFWEPHHPQKNPNVHIDLYSCAPFAYEDVIRVAHEYFQLAEWTGNYIERTLNPADRNTLLLHGMEGNILERSSLHF